MIDKPKIFSASPLIIDSIGVCDACSPIILTQSLIKPMPEFSKTYYSTNPSSIRRTINSTHDILLTPFSRTSVVLNRAALTCFQQFEFPKPLDQGIQNISYKNNWPQPLIQSIVNQMIALDLLVPKSLKLPDTLPIHSESRTTLAAWLHVTDRCNLRCLYCYLPHKHLDMSLKIGYASIDATFRSALTHNYQRVKFKYAGGEPLLRPSFVFQLHQYAQVIAEQYDLELDGVVLSNGTLLTKEIIRKLKTLGLRLMISIDNLGGESQSKKTLSIQRPFLDGTDSANDAIKAIELALDCGLVPNVSITVSGRNIENLPTLLSWLLARDLPFNFNFCREHTGDSRGLGLEEKKIIEGMRSAYRIIEANLPRRSLLASLIDRADLSSAHLRPCSVGCSYLVFDPFGWISKCQMQISDFVTNCSAIDPLKTIQEDKNGIQNLSVEEKEDCRVCEWKYFCGGGCPLESYRSGGRYDKASPNCNIYKDLYPEVMRLEGVRLLTYFDEMA